MVEKVIPIACRAGEFLKDNFGRVHQLHVKGDRNFATEIDRAAERMIVDDIKRGFPGQGILAEEEERSDLENEYLWIIDPLDGTHNYIQHIPVYGVSIGLVRNGDFVLGVIYMPQDNELYVAQKNNGAYKNGQKITVSKKQNLKECSISFDSSIRHSPDIMLRTLGAVAGEVFNVRMLGSSARLLSYVAEGKLDAAIEYHDQPWDFAAGVCIIREAHGVFTDLRGEKVTSHTVGYLAAPAAIHTQLSPLIIV
ncbi:MAG: inositol monophosphatase [Candidatus Omnitrophica bacterium]|nr:inositol monophosphatase [Candidatus Omnitrophota bacterium]